MGGLADVTEDLSAFGDRAACSDAERRAALWLHDELRERGHEAWVETVWVRHGRDGSVLHEASADTPVALVPGPVVDVTGAGDAMLAAFCHALLDGAEPASAAAYGHAAAALTIASPHTVRPDLTDRLVRSLL